MTQRSPRVRSVAMPIAALALAAGALTAPAASAATAPKQVDATYTDAEGVVHYAFDPRSLPSSTVASQRGQRTAAGRCRFADEDAGASASRLGPNVSVSRELAFDARTCRRDLV